MEETEVSFAYRTAFQKLSRYAVMRLNPLYTAPSAFSIPAFNAAITLNKFKIVLSNKASHLHYDTLEGEPKGEPR